MGLRSMFLKLNGATPESNPAGYCPLHFIALHGALLLHLPLAHQSHYATYSLSKH